MVGARASRALLILVTLTWGLNFISVRWALEATTIWGFRTVTFGIGTLLLIAIALITRVRLRLRRWQDYVHLAVAGFFSISIFGALLAASLVDTNVGQASIITYTMPIWVALLSAIVLKERLTQTRLLAVALGVTGLGVLSYPMLTQGITRGTVTALFGALAWATGTVYLKWARVQAPTLTVTIWQLIFGNAILTTIFVVSGDPLIIDNPPATVWIGLAYSTVFGTALAYLLWFQVVQSLPASVAGLGMLFVPVAAMVFGVVLLGEGVTLDDAVAFSLIFVAGLLALRDDRPRSARAATA